MASRSRGWIRINRTTIEASDQLWAEKPFDRWRARLDLLGGAAYAPYLQQVASRKIPLERGELLASRAYLVNRWGWGGGQVRGFVEMLVSEDFMVAIRRTSIGTIYRIVDYDAWDAAKPAPASKSPSPAAPGPPPLEGASDAVRAEWEQKVIDRAAAQLPEIPEALRTTAFEGAWRSRLIERAEKLSRGKLTRTQAAGQFKDLLRVAEMWGVEQAVRVVKRATSSGYAAVVYPSDLETPTDMAKGRPRQATLFGPVEDPGVANQDETRQAIVSPEWGKILDELRESMENEDFSTYITPLKPVGFEDGELTLEAPNRRFVGILLHGFKGVLEGAASGIARVRLIPPAGE